MMYGIPNRELKLKLSKVKYQMCGHMNISGPPAAPSSDPSIRRLSRARSLRPSVDLPTSNHRVSESILQGYKNLLELGF